MSANHILTCHEVDELAGLYVLDALDAAEAKAVADHLERCPEAHDSYADLAAMASSLSLAVPEIVPPPELRDRVIAAVGATPQLPDVPAAATGAAPSATTKVEPWPIEPASPTAAPVAGRSGWAWLGLAAIVVAIVFVSIGIVSTLQRDAERSQLYQRAVAAATDPTSNVAVLTGSDVAAGADGYAVFPDGQPGFVVIEGLPPLGHREAYQAWFVGEGDPVSAGLINVSPDGLGTLTGLQPVPGTVVVAVTVEERPGALAPTGSPVIAGELPTATA